MECPPDGGKKSFLSLLQDERINDCYSVACGASKVVDLTNEIQSQSKAKRRAEVVAADAAQAADSNSKAKASTFAEAAAAGSASAKIMIASYWDSPKAKLFLGSSKDHRSIVEVLQERIERLQQFNKSPDGWRDLVEWHDVDHVCSAYDVFIT